MDNRVTKRMYGYVGAYLLLALAIFVANHVIWQHSWLAFVAMWVPTVMPQHLMWLKKRGKITFSDIDYLLISLFMGLIGLSLYTLFYFL